jgi:hypothetical protein
MSGKAHGYQSHVRHYGTEFDILMLDIRHCWRMPSGAQL